MKEVETQVPRGSLGTANLRQDPAQEGEKSQARWAAREGQTDHHGQGQVGYPTLMS